MKVCGSGTCAAWSVCACCFGSWAGASALGSASLLCALTGTLLMPHGAGSFASQCASTIVAGATFVVCVAAGLACTAPARLSVNKTVEIKDVTFTIYTPGIVVSDSVKVGLMRKLYTWRRLPGSTAYHADIKPYSITYCHLFFFGANVFLHRNNSIHHSGARTDDLHYFNKLICLSALIR